MANNPNNWTASAEASESSVRTVSITGVTDPLGYTPHSTKPLSSHHPSLPQLTVSFDRVAPPEQCSPSRGSCRLYSAAEVLQVVQLDSGPPPTPHSAFNADTTPRHYLQIRGDIATPASSSGGASSVSTPLSSRALLAGGPDAYSAPSNTSISPLFETFNFNGTSSSPFPESPCGRLPPSPSFPDPQPSDARIVEHWPPSPGLLLDAGPRGSYLDGGLPLRVPPDLARTPLVNNVPFARSHITRTQSSLAGIPYSYPLPPLPQAGPGYNLRPSHQVFNPRDGPYVPDSGSHHYRDQLAPPPRILECPPSQVQTGDHGDGDEERPSAMNTSAIDCFPENSPQHLTVEQWWPPSPSSQGFTSASPSPSTDLNAEMHADANPQRNHLKKYKCTSPKVREAAERRRKRAPNFVCSICCDSFTSRQNLKNHDNSHTGIRPFVCGDCGKDYRHSRSLSRHRAAEHLPPS